MLCVMHSVVTDHYVNKENAIHHACKENKIFSDALCNAVGPTAKVITSKRLSALIPDTELSTRSGRTN